jgi:hypothetical protein
MYYMTLYSIVNVYVRVRMVAGAHVQRRLAVMGWTLHA